MARLEIPAGSLEYYELGSGVPVVLTPGGAKIITLFPAQELPVSNKY